MLPGSTVHAPFTRPSDSTVGVREALAEMEHVGRLLFPAPRRSALSTSLPLSGPPEADFGGFHPHGRLIASTKSRHWQDRGGWGSFSLGGLCLPLTCWAALSHSYSFSLQDLTTLLPGC